MGVVYLGQHTLLGRRAAIKVLLPALSARPDIVNRFFNEARAVTSISDPGIVQVFDFGYHTDGSAFIVMEFLEGEALDQRLAKLRRFSVHEALRLGRQMASSLAAAHAQHIVHRDLKPENIFLVRDAEVASGERTKILDFGIAKLSDDHPGKLKTNAGALMGTPVYMSPEQCRGLTDIDHRSDIYALGCVVFHLIVGRPPFEGEGMGDIISAHIREPAPAPSSLVAGIPPSVDALVLRCLAKAPADRYQSMAELAAALGQLLQYVPVEAASPYAQGAEPGAMPGMPPAYASRPPTPPPPRPTSPPASYASPAAPTTLGASAGQVPSTSPRPPRLGRWIAGVLVLGAVGAGIAIVATHEDGAPLVVATTDEPGSAASAEPPAPAEPPAAPPGSPNAGGASAPEAGAAAAVAPAPPTPAPSPAVPTGANPSDAAVPAIAVEPAPSVAPTPIATSVPAKKPSRSRDPVRKTPAPPRAHTTSTRSAAATTAPNKCSKADFAAVYEAAVPAPGAVRAALRNLKACRDAGAISDTDFDRYQSALVAKL
jgi:serine/threonine-protein kinase